MQFTVTKMTTGNNLRDEESYNPNYEKIPRIAYLKESS